MVFRCLISRVSVSNPYSKVGRTVAWKILVLVLELMRGFRV